jgi:hypothetical protein
MRLVAFGVARPPQRLAIQPHRHQHRWAAIIIGGRVCAQPGQAHQPPADNGIDSVGVRVGEHSPDRGLRRWPPRQGTRTHEQLRQDRCRDIGDPPGDGGVTPHPGDHCRRSQSQHHRNRVVATLIRPAITDPAQQFQQVTTHLGDRYRHHRPR